MPRERSRKLASLSSRARHAERPTPNRFSGASTAPPSKRIGAKKRLLDQGRRIFHSNARPDGKRADFEIKYAFGLYPLQQYLIELPAGRIQAFGLAWDARPAAQGGQRWFDLIPIESSPPEILCIGRASIRTGIFNAPGATQRICRKTTTRRQTAFRRAGARSASDAKPVMGPPPRISPGRARARRNAPRRRSKG